ncbi:MAG TPA: hypothetical protein VFQ15_03820 [Jiangellaceae bacterium]|nr:hypothetical protein [Jiangellaceae bacterium]
MTSSNTAGPMAGPSYPLPTPAGGDARFSYGLLHDIAKALQDNGFPRPEGADWARLMTALGSFLYQSKETL